MVMLRWFIFWYMDSDCVIVVNILIQAHLLVRQYAVWY